AAAAELNRRGVPTLRNAAKWRHEHVLKLRKRLGLYENHLHDPHPYGYRGTLEGRTRGQAKGRATREMVAQQYAEKLRHDFNEFFGMKDRAVAVELNRREIKTLKGAQWHVMTVSRIRKRLGLCERHSRGGDSRVARMAADLAPIVRELQAAGKTNLMVIA